MNQLECREDCFRRVLVRRSGLIAFEAGPFVVQAGPFVDAAGPFAARRRSTGGTIAGIPIRAALPDPRPPQQPGAGAQDPNLGCRVQYRVLGLGLGQIKERREVGHTTPDAFGCVTDVVCEAPQRRAHAVDLGPRDPRDVVEVPGRVVRMFHERLRPVGRRGQEARPRSRKVAQFGEDEEQHDEYRDECRPHSNRHPRGSEPETVPGNRDDGRVLDQWCKKDWHEWRLDVIGDRNMGLQRGAIQRYLQYMPSFVVSGGSELGGTIRPAGNKNAALPVLAATLMSTEPVTIRNVPRIRDVRTLVDIMRALGAEVTWTGPNVVRVDGRNVSEGALDPALSARIRASILLAGPLLARFGSLSLPPPGGDVIGRRRLDTHVLAFRALGADVETSHGLDLHAPQLVGTNMFLDEPSVTATENAIMAASLARGETVIRNAAAEPHVQDLCRFLNAMGARIGGIGTGNLVIEGVSSLGGADFTIGPDHVETGSFIGLAAVTRSRLVIEDAPMEHLDAILIGFRRMGIDCRPDGRNLIVDGRVEPVIRMDAFGHLPKVDDGPWPAFPADLTSIAVVAATCARGTILIHEKMFESRMYFTDKLVAMGARIVLCDPHRAVVVGPSPLRGGRVESPDIRAGMAILIAALGARGESVIRNAGQIERGYERIDERLTALGARIERRD